MLFGRSLIYARNSSGPNTVPCGTPESTSAQVECSPPTTTRWTRYDDDSLDTVLEKTADPGMSFILDTIVIEFLKKPIMREDIERFAKIHDDHVNLFFVIKGMS